MEEERARQAQQQRAVESGAGSSTLETVPENQSTTMDTVPISGPEAEDEEERMLAEALALSTQEEEDVEMGDGGEYIQFTNLSRPIMFHQTVTMMRSVRKRLLRGQSR